MAFLVALDLSFASAQSASEPSGVSLHHARLTVRTPDPGVHYEVSFGTLEPTAENLDAWVKIHPELQDNAWIGSVELVEQNRSGASAGAALSLSEAVSSVKTSLRAKTLHSIKYAKQLYRHWVHDDINRLRLKYTTISMFVDGTSTGSLAYFYEGASLPAAALIGMTMASLSGATSLYQAKLARFFGPKVSMVNRWLKRPNRSKVLALDVEGMAKWLVLTGGIQLIFQFVSNETGVLQLDGAGDLLLSAFATAGMMTTGQGLYDYASNIEFEEKTTTNDPKALYKPMNKLYLWTTAAACLNVLGGFAANNGLEIGDYVLQTLTVAGVWKYYVLRKEIFKSYSSALMGIAKEAVNMIRTAKEWLLPDCSKALREPEAEASAPFR